MKICLIVLNTWHFNTKQDWYGLSSRGGYAPSTLRVLMSLIPQNLEAEVQCLDENVQRIDFDSIEADLVGISVLTSNANRAYQISADLQKKGITVVLGGFHITALPEEAIQFANSIVVGSAENNWDRLLQDFAHGNMKKRYDEDSSEAFNKHLPLVENPEFYKKKYLLPHTLEISRGCYNNCSFCAIPNFCSNKYLQKPVSSVIDEIRFLKAKTIVFLDSSPFEEKDYALEIFEELKKLKVKWYSCLTTKKAEDVEFLAKAEESGCQGALIGFESIKATNLQSTNKKINKPENYSQIIENLNRQKITILGSFVFGFDEDDTSIFENTYDFVRLSGIDLLHFAILTPFPGTTLYRQLLSEQRILTQDWSKYDGAHVVFQPKNLSPEQLQQGYFSIYKKSHSLNNIAKRVTNNPHNLLLKFATNFGFRLYAHNFIKRHKNENHLY